MTPITLSTPLRRVLAPGAPPRLRAALALLLAVALACLAGVGAYLTALDRGTQATRGAAVHRLDLYAASIEREIDKYAHFPFLVGLDSTVRDVLAHPDSFAGRGRADDYLEELNRQIGTLAVFILDRSGRVIAASNWNRYDSFVGRDLSYRPYFQNARVGEVSRFYGIGTTNREPGYYISTALQAGGTMIGVAVVKVSLEQLERSWSSAESPAILSDEHGVVVLSSVPDWKYGTLAPLGAAARADIAAAQQYNDRALQPIGMEVRREIAPGTRIVHLASGAGDTAVFATAGLFLAESRQMPGTPWQLTVFSDLGEAVNSARLQAALATLALLLAAGAFAWIDQRRRHLDELLRARAALQAAHDHLEAEVIDRTAALRATNARLSEEIEERNRAERTLREAQAGLVEAGKLAVIGQLSAGIAHELNQPLAALSTLAGNGVKFLDRGDIASARGNLERLGPLIARMGNLTGELKTFARKSSGEAQSVPVLRLVDDALFLLHHRLVQGGVSVTTEGLTPALAAWCDPNRIAQVLLNLLGNALDAMEDRPDRRLAIAAGPCAGGIFVEVRDSGPGLPPDRLGTRFEAFYTTKGPGRGLGLGLAISAGILRDHGGTLTAERGVEGGAVFRFTLPATPAPEKAR